MKPTLKTTPLVLLSALLISACGLLSPPAEASGEIEAVPLEVETQSVEITEPPPLEATEAPLEEAPYPAVQDPSGGLLVYQINPDDSEVRFVLDEVLRGSPTTVVGTTNQVAGEIAIDLADLSTAQLGVIQINARTLLTDNNFRNRAIQNEILDTGDFEFITFAPTSLAGLPASIAPGEEVTFTITGDLTIRDVTQPVVFEVTAKAENGNQLIGTASTIIKRADYNLIIPSVQQVADVEEEVELYIDFVAVAG